MKGDKKSDRPSIGVPGRSEGSGTCEVSSDPVFQSTTSAPPGQRISALLPCGASHAVPLRDLVALTGWNERVVRRQIEAERRRGVPILADCKNGYFLPDNEGEKALCVQSMRGRAKEILRTAAAIERGEIGQDE